MCTIGKCFKDQTYPLIDFSHKEYLKRGKVIPELKCLPLNTEVKGTWISTLKFEISAITGTRNGLLKVSDPHFVSMTRCMKKKLKNLLD